MKLQATKLAVLNAVAEHKKATYAQATSGGGNGRTCEALVVDGLLEKKTDKAGTVTYGLTGEGKAALKAASKAKPKTVGV